MGKFKIMKTVRKSSAKFVIKSFDDYHDIDFVFKDWVAKELGCFRPKTGYDYNRCFAVFWKGRKPTKTQINNSLKEKIFIGEVDYGYPLGKELQSIETSDIRYP